MIIGREASLGLRLVGVSNTQPIKPFDTIIVIKGYFVQNEWSNLPGNLQRTHADVVIKDVVSSRCVQDHTVFVPLSGS